MNTIFSPVLITVLTLSLVACGGGGGSSGGGNSVPLDTDNDTVADTSDNCLNTVNLDQRDTDNDGEGDACDLDDDNDGIEDIADIDDDNDNLIEIASLEQLNWVRNDLQGTSLISPTGPVGNEGCLDICNGYELVADLDFDTNADGVMSDADTFYDYDGDNLNNGWLPIGNYDSPFQANFDGNGFSISNLYINRDFSDTETLGAFIGLFGLVTSDAEALEIRNLTLDGDLMQVAGDRNTGALVGETDFGITINNSHVEGTVSGEIITGGLVGYANNCTISDSTSSATVSGGAQTGGLVGLAIDGTLSNSSASGDVTGEEDTGGLVGQIDGAELTNVYASGTVTGRLYTGGLVGFAGPNATISDSYASGDLSANGAISEINYIGGLIGSVNYKIGSSIESALVTVDKSFATGTVDAAGSNFAGGLVGGSYDLSLTNCFATGAVNNGNRYVGGIIGEANYGTSAARCFAANPVAGNENPGAFAGDIFTSSYSENWFANDLGLSNGIGFSGGSSAIINSASLAQLQSATSAGDGGYFAGWSEEVWDFGTSDQLPGLIINNKVYRDADVNPD